MALRERKKAQTREAIIAEAFALFERRGFELTTVDQIAEAADVSRRTFFRYFGTKEAVVFPDRDQRFPRFQALLADAQPGESPFARVKRALLALADDYMSAREQVRARRRIVDTSPALQAYDLELDREWEATIARALLPERTQKDDQRRAALIAGALMGGIRACLEIWFAGQCRGDLAALGRDAVGLLEPGVLATVGPKRATTTKGRTVRRKG